MLSFKTRAIKEQLKVKFDSVYQSLYAAFQKGGMGDTTGLMRLLNAHKKIVDELENQIHQAVQEGRDISVDFEKRADSEKVDKGDTLISCKETVTEYITHKDWRVNANANAPYSSAALVSNTAGKIIANFWLDEVYSPEEGKAHRCADYHIHDLDCLTGYCAGWSLRQLLNEGFNGVPGKVSSKPPRHFREALGQMANFLGILQSEWAGAQAFSSFDTYLAPYVFRDKLSYKDVKKAITQFIYNLNVPARWGQSPFTNITIDITPPPDLQDKFPTVADEHLLAHVEDPELLKMAQKKGVQSLTDLTYKHFVKEMHMIVKAYYDVMMEGDSCGQPFTFPIPTVNLMPDFDWDSDIAESLFQSSAKLGTSYFQNFIGSQYITTNTGEMVKNPEAYEPHAVRSMCCRLRLDLRELLKRGNGLFGSAEMTGSLGVVTINMARLGYRFKHNIVGLKAELKRLMGLAKSTLEKKREFIQDMYNRGLFPYTKRYLPGFRNHFSTIGVNGMNEMIRNFTDGVSDITSEAGIKMAKEVLEMMREELQYFQQETGNLYNLEATPAEGATYRFAKEDKKRYPNILQAGEWPHIYYTNSSQIPAGYTDDPFTALELQDDLQCKYTGGTVLHLYISEKISSPESCKQLVKKVMTRYKLPNITITPIFSICPEHGYLSGEQIVCSQCNSETMVWTRVMGYHRPVESFNLGKKGEHKERQYFQEKHWKKS